MFSRGSLHPLPPFTLEMRKYIPHFAFFNLIFISATLLIESKLYWAILVAAVPLCILALFNFKSILYFLPVSFFLNFHRFGFAVSEWIALLLILSFFLAYRNINLSDCAIPLSFPFLAYYSVMMLSIVKSANMLLSLYSVNHFLLLVGLMAVMSAVIVTEGTILRLLAIFLACVGLNSIHVIIQAALTGKRVFGFAGIMFVDYVGVGIIFSTVLSLFSRRRHYRLLFLILTGLFTIALILTQTRTIWATTFTTLLVIIGFISIRRSYFEFQAGSFRRFIIFLIAFICIGLSTALIFNPRTLVRLSEVGNTSEADVTESGLVKNSLVSRVFIWHTAYNAFRENPVLGIGAYAFPFSSQYYYTIPKYFYKNYVEKLTPHQTFIAVAVETGILGLAAFIVLWILILRYIFKGMQSSNTFEEKRISAVLGGGVIYCLISMFITDAWLWGQGIILFGFILGSFFVYEKLKRIRPKRLSSFREDIT